MKCLSALFYFSLCSAAFAQASAGSTVAALGYLYPVPGLVAPGQLITVFLTGNLQGDITAAVQQTNTYPAPVLEVRPNPGCQAPSPSPCVSYTAVTIQIPYEMIPTCFVCAVVYNYSTQLIVSVGGAPLPVFQLTPLADRVHLLTACDTAVPASSGAAPIFGLPCAPLVTHPDGSLVTAQRPANVGEVLTAYAVGLGLTNPAVATGHAAATATPTVETFFLDFDFRRNTLASQPTVPGNSNSPVDPAPLYTGLVPGYPGLYQVNFAVLQPPSGAAVPPCSGTIQSNLTVSVGGQFSFDGAGICVEP